MNLSDALELVHGESEATEQAEKDRIGGNEPPRIIPFPRLPKRPLRKPAKRISTKTVYRKAS